MDIKENTEQVILTVEESNMLSEVIEDIVYKNKGRYGISQIGVLIDVYRKLEYPENYNKETNQLYVDGDVYKQDKVYLADMNANDTVNSQRYTTSYNDFNKTGNVKSE